MKGYAQIYVVSTGEDGEPDVAAAVETIRAIPGVVMADQLFTFEDIMVVMEAEDQDAFEEVLSQVESVPNVSVAEVRLARLGGATRAPYARPRRPH